MSLSAISESIFYLTGLMLVLFGAGFAITTIVYAININKLHYKQAWGFMAVFLFSIFMLLIGIEILTFE